MKRFLNVSFDIQSKSRKKIGEVKCFLIYKSDEKIVEERQASSFEYVVAQIFQLIVAHYGKKEIYGDFTISSGYNGISFDSVNDFVYTHPNDLIVFKVDSNSLKVTIEDGEMEYQKIVESSIRECLKMYLEVLEHLIDASFTLQEIETLGSMEKRLVYDKQRKKLEMEYSEGENIIDEMSIAEIKMFERISRFQTNFENEIQKLSREIERYL